VEAAGFSERSLWRNCARIGCRKLPCRAARVRLREKSEALRLYQDAAPGRLHSSGGGGRRPSAPTATNPGLFFYGTMQRWAAPPSRRRASVGIEKFVCVGTIVLTLPSSRRCPSGKRISGTAIRKRPTRHTAWRKKCCWCQLQAYRQQYGMNGIYVTPVNLYGPRDNFDLQTSTRHSRADPQVLGITREAGTRGGSACLGNGKRHTANFSTSRMPPKPSSWPQRNMLKPIS